MKKFLTKISILSLFLVSSAYAAETSTVTFIIEADINLSVTNVLFPAYFTGNTAPTATDSYVSNSGTVNILSNTATAWQLTVDGATAGTYTLNAGPGYDLTYQLFTDIPQDAVSSAVPLVSSAGVQANPIAGREVINPGTLGNFYNASVVANPSASVRFAIPGTAWAAAIASNADAFTSERTYTDTLTWTFQGT